MTPTPLNPWLRRAGLLLASLLVTALVMLAASAGAGAYMRWAGALTPSQEALLRGALLVAPGLAVLAGVWMRRRAAAAAAAATDSATTTATPAARRG
jgi:hypothetical protein